LIPLPLFPLPSLLPHSVAAIIDIVYHLAYFVI